MEAWFLADRETLAGYFGQGFRINALSMQPNVELIDKLDVFESLKAATRNCKTKKPYHKTRHGYELVGLIRPDEVRRGSPTHAARLFDCLAKACAHIAK